MVQLLRRASRTVEELAQALGLTDNAVRAHLATLERDGLVRQGGLRRLVFVIDARSRRPGSSLYLVTTRAGEGLAGNVGALPTGILENSGWTETAYRRHDDPEGVEHQALVRVF